MIMPEKKYTNLLEIKQVERWFKDCRRGSEITADVNLRRLGVFLNHVNMGPMDLITLEEGQLTDLITDFVSDLEDDGISPNYIASIMKGVKSWLTFNNRKLIRKIKIRDAGRNTRYGDEKIPTVEELRKILKAGDPRSRVACVLMAHSGLRPEVIGNYRGTGGLRISDFPEMSVDPEGKKVTFQHPVTLVNVRAELSKTGKPYTTFLGPEGCSYLSAYLEKRIAEGEMIAPETPIVAPSKLALRGSRSFITSINIGDIVRKSIRSAGFPQRPYVLRAFFDTQLMIAESKGQIMHDYRVFFMGHTGSIEHVYTMNKQLTSETLEDMRSAYARSLKFLETEEHAMKEEDYVKQLRESAIMAIEVMAGISFSDEEKEKLYSASPEEFQERLRDLAKDRQAMALNNGNRHKTIPEGDLEEYLNSGWELVQIYPRGDKAVVRLP